MLIIWGLAFQTGQLANGIEMGKLVKDSGSCRCEKICWFPGVAPTGAVEASVRFFEVWGVLGVVAGDQECG